MIDDLEKEPLIVELRKLVQEIEGGGLKQRERTNIINIATQSLSSLYESIGETTTSNNYEWLIREQISFWIWKITESPKVKKSPKYKRQKYWTEKALRQYKENAGKFHKLRHEHVFEKKKIADRIVISGNNKEKIKQELNSAESCIITSYEHKDLHSNPELDGWQRYETCGIVVYDISGEHIKKRYN